MKQLLPLLVLLAGCPRPHAIAPAPVGDTVVVPAGWVGVGGGASLDLVAIGGDAIELAEHAGGCGAPIAIEPGLDGSGWIAIDGGLCLELGDRAVTATLRSADDDWAHLAGALAPIATYLRAAGHLPAAVRVDAGSFAWLAGIPHEWDARASGDGVALERWYQLSRAAVQLTRVDGDCGAVLRGQLTDAPLTIDGWSPHAAIDGGAIVMCKELGGGRALGASIDSGDGLTARDLAVLLVGLRVASS